MHSLRYVGGLPRPALQPCGSTLCHTALPPPSNHHHHHRLACLPPHVCPGARPLCSAPLRPALSLCSLLLLLDQLPLTDECRVIPWTPDPYDAPSDMRKVRPASRSCWMRAAWQGAGGGGRSDVWLHWVGVGPIRERAAHLPHASLARPGTTPTLTTCGFRRTFTPPPSAAAAAGLHAAAPPDAWRPPNTSPAAAPPPPSPSRHPVPLLPLPLPAAAAPPEPAGGPGRGGASAPAAPRV